jgi:hypothetical protein
MAEWRATKTPGVYVAHSRRCRAYTNAKARCRCEPSCGEADGGTRRPTGLSGRSRGRRTVTRSSPRSPRIEKAAEHVEEAAERGRLFEDVGGEWLAGVKAGRISRRRGRGQTYSETTIADYRRSYRRFLEPEFGPMVAEEICEVEWQMWVDQLSSEGLSRSRIASHVAVASAIYAWALSPSRRFVTRNPLRLFELPPNDEKPRMRVAFAEEATQLLAALEPEDQVPYALAFYSGLRRSEVDRLEWTEVLDGDRIGGRVLFTRAKSTAGTERRSPRRCARC